MRLKTFIITIALALLSIASASAYSPADSASIIRKMTASLTKPTTGFKLDKAGIVRLKNEEGQPFTYRPGVGAAPVLVCYDDFGQVAGYYGNTRPGWKVGDTLDARFADKILMEDVHIVEGRVSQLLTALPYRANWNSKLLHPIAEALFDLVYRSGMSSTINSPFYQRLLKCYSDDMVQMFSNLRFACMGIENSCLNHPEKTGPHDRNLRRQNLCLLTLVP